MSSVITVDEMGAQQPSMRTAVVVAAATAGIKADWRDPRFMALLEHVLAEQREREREDMC